MGKGARERAIRHFDDGWVATSSDFRELGRMCDVGAVHVLEAAYGSTSRLEVLELQGYGEPSSTQFRVLLSAETVRVWADGSILTIESLLALGRNGWSTLPHRLEGG
jgi:hypothetical protein